MILLLTSVIAIAGDPDLPPMEALVPATKSETTAKKRIYDTLYVDHATTFYCGCPFNPEEKTPDLAACGMSDLTSMRAQRVEVEHVVAAVELGRDRPCWEEGGREHCLKVDPVYKAAHNDLHNLFPTVGQINGDRRDYGWGYVAGDNKPFGNCEFQIDSDNNRAEPPEAVRGDIARTYFYMSWQYGVALTEGQRRLFLSWDKADPVDEWEIERDRRIEAIQGNSNPFVR